MALSTLGTDPDYASLLGGVNRDPRLLMAQKLMDVEKLPTNNSTQSSFWANLLNQGARGALGGYLYQGVQKDREKEATAQATEAAEFNRMLAAGPPGGSSPKGGGDAAPAAPAPAPGPRASLGAGALPPDQQQAIVTSATNGTMVPPPLLHALITQESGWKPNAQGKGSDFGLGQVTASTAANPGYGLPPLSDADRADPYKNAAWSARYLEARGKAAGLTRPEDWSDPAKIALALKAYNGGGDPNYVQNVTRHMQAPGKQADASPPPGSNIDALMAGVNQPKPRGIQLAENLFPGTATDAPTPILPDMGDAQGTAVPRVPVASAALDAPGAAAPAMRSPAAASVPGANLELPAPPDAAALPLPSPAVVPAPAAAIPSPPPDLMPEAGPAPAIVPAPDAASVPTPDLANAAPVPAIVPQPDAASVPQPEPALVPDNPLSRADPASLAAFNGAPPQPTPAVVPPPDPAIVPPPAPAMVPRPAAATLPPVQGPPVPPELLARKLQQSAPAPDNVTEALNTASLAAARRGENFVPGAGPTGPQLAAPLMSWAGNLTDAGAPLLTPAGAAGGPTGPQLAAPLQPPGAPGAASQQGGPVPLVTPASGPGDATGATTDTSATGGQSKGAAPSAPATAASTADAQAKADWYLKMAREAQASSNPRIRSQAGVLEAQGQMYQRSVDRQTALNDRLAASRDARETALANRNLPIHEMQGDDGKMHSWQVLPDGTKRDLGLARDQREPTAVHTVKLRGDDGKEHMFVVKPDGTKTDLGPTQADSNADFGKSEDARALNTYRDLYPVMARGQPNDQQRADYEAARTVLLKPKTQMSQSGQTIETPGRLPDLSKIYGPVPGEEPIPTEQKLPQGAYRTGSGSIVYPGPQQPVPEKVVSEMLTNVNGLRQVQTTAESLRKNPDAVGPIAGAFPEVRSWFDPSGVPTQAAISALKAMKIHEISGAAVTASEEPRLIPWIPGLRDTKEVALAKLERFATEYGNILRDKYEVYGPDSNHQANPVVERALLASPVEYTDDKAYERMRSGQVYRAPDGKLRTKQ